LLKTRLCNFLQFVVVVIISIGSCALFAQEPVAQPGRAEQAFATFGPSIYQVRIINLKSQNLNSSGSGFYVADGSLFATNYHVVSSVVLEPEEYKIVIEKGEDEYELEVVAIDIVNDLAVLSTPNSGKPLLLREQSPAKGEKMYSIGNPHNIGMTIVEGNYNGLADDYVFDRIHFSGALNPGMSGGPTIDAAGRVVGVNVQTAGNQVGFLVPVEKLAILLGSLANEPGSSEENFDVRLVNTDAYSVAKTDNYKKLQKNIGEQILKATSTLIDGINSSEWPLEELAGATVVGEIHPGFHCWGQSDTDEKKKILTVVKGCNSRQSIYVSRELNSGYFEYEFRYLEGDEWPSSAFYRHATQEFSQGRPSNRAGEDDVDNFTCVNDVVEQDENGIRKRAAFCARPYKKFAGLYDTFYMAVTVDKKNRALMEHFCLSGVDKNKSNEFLSRFIKQVVWQ